MDELAALRLQIEWGADEAIADAPQNWLRAAPGPPSAPAPEWAATLPRPAQAEADARARASATLAELEAAVAGFTGCPLRDTAFRLVFGDGEPAARLMLIGEVPGADEDRAGRPFAGPAGAYLDKMLASIGLERAAIRIGMLVPWRPPGGRPPTESEIALCLPFLLRHIALVDPARLVLLGPLAARALLPLQQRGRRPPQGWVEAAIPADGGPRSVLAMASPATVRAKPATRPAAWADLRRLRRALADDMPSS
ncbi:MAG: uracil-DNA glycosylase [Alphaproteobacteria bacterium]|nr:uracil-DNA glycosylase [Alphaproteobacteria bacterium]